MILIREKRPGNHAENKKRARADRERRRNFGSACGTNQKKKWDHISRETRKGGVALETSPDHHQYMKVGPSGIKNHWDAIKRKLVRN